MFVMHAVFVITALIGQIEAAKIVEDLRSPFQMDAYE